MLFIFKYEVGTKVVLSKNHPFSQKVGEIQGVVENKQHNNKQQQYIYKVRLQEYNAIIHVNSADFNYICNKKK